MSLGVRKGFELGSVNGIVFTNIDIVRILRNGQIAAVRDIRKGLIRRRSDFNRLTVNLSLLISFLSPLSRDNIGCLAVFHQIHGNHGKLQACPSLQKQHLIIIRNIHKLP